MSVEEIRKKLFTKKSQIIHVPKSPRKVPLLINKMMSSPRKKHAMKLAGWLSPNTKNVSFICHIIIILTVKEPHQQQT